MQPRPASASHSQRGRHGGAESTHAGNNGDAGAGGRRGAAALPSDFHGFYYARHAYREPVAILSRVKSDELAVRGFCQG